VLAAEVVGLPDSEWGSRLVAAVVPADPSMLGAGAEATALTGALAGKVEQSLGRAARPRAVHLLDSLPLLESGKADRQALLAWAANPDRMPR
jgi:O-succinylbenzoic acid--CoA ligase